VGDIVKRISIVVPVYNEEENIAHFAAAVEQEPNNWKAWFNLSCMYDAGGERKRARAAMRNAWALRSGGQAKDMR